MTFEKVWSNFLKSGDPIIMLSDVQADWVEYFIKTLLVEERRQTINKILSEIGRMKKPLYKKGEYLPNGDFNAALELIANKCREMK